MSRLHSEQHNITRIGWLRAAVLGANDGIVSTASLIVGVAAAAAGKPEVLLAGSAGLAAGALWVVALSTLPVALMLVLSGVLINVIQVGFLATFKPMAPKLCPAPPGCLPGARAQERRIGRRGRHPVW